MGEQQPPAATFLNAVKRIAGHLLRDLCEERLDIELDDLPERVVPGQDFGEGLLVHPEKVARYLDLAELARWHGV
jgi:hypothetical protein